MKPTTKILLGTGLAACAFSGQLMAQETQAPGFQPVEMFTCNYNKGKDRKDLDKVNAKFSKWADANDPGYTAWALTPAYTSADITFDVAWLGTWNDFASQGKSGDNWPVNGIQADFDKVITCDSHASAASVMITPPANEAPPASAVIMFSSCTNADGVSPEQAYEAHVKMSAYMKSKGSTAGAWAFYPGMGSGDLDFDHYFIRGYADFKAVAHDSEAITNGGGYMKAGEIFKGVTSCDIPRAYAATLVHAGS